MPFCGMSCCFGLFQILRVNISVECELKLLSIPHECNLLISMAACLPLEDLRQYLSLGGCNDISDKSTAMSLLSGQAL